MTAKLRNAVMVLLCALVILAAKGHSAAAEGKTRVLPPLDVRCRSWALVGEPVDLLLAFGDAQKRPIEDALYARFTASIDGSASFLPVPPVGGVLVPNGTSTVLAVDTKGHSARIFLSDSIPEVVRITVRAEGIATVQPESQNLTVKFLDPGKDDDGDGLTNRVERELGSDPLAGDSDGDGLQDAADNCSTVPNRDQRDEVRPGGAGDACEDLDKDGVADASDNCPDLFNPEQRDGNANGVGDDCENDGTAQTYDASFNVPFAFTRAVFDPVRPYVYVSQKTLKKVYFVNLETGVVEREFSFTTMPESMALSPDGSRLYVALLTREHSYYWWDGDHEGYVASFDLATQVKDRELHITEDPYDLAVTSDGHLVVPSGSGQWTYIRVFDAVTGAETGAVSGARQMSHLTLHPSEGKVYTADTDSSPSDIERYDLLPGGGIAWRWDSPYHGDHRMSGGVWASPAGDVLVTRGGDLFTAGTARSQDMIYISGLSVGSVTNLAWDGPGRVIFTLEGQTVHYYNLVSRLEIGRKGTVGTAYFIGLNGGQVYLAITVGSTTQIVSFAHPAPGGATNTAPVARFAVSPETPQTTQTDLTFDASTSTDAEDGLSSLQFRWDFDNDGVWDTAFQSSPTVKHRYNTAGTKVIRLEVRDHLALVGDVLQSIDVAFESDPGGSGPSNPPFSLPFAVTDAVFDPVRPYVYVSQKAAKKVDFVNLQTGFIEREFNFANMPESLALSPDGSRLYVALLTREHSSVWFDGDHEAYVAGFDLAAQVKDREFHITEDPYDLVATSDGHLVVPSGSGQWTYVREFDAVTGAQTGAVSGVRHMSRMTLHPSEGKVYTADTDQSPGDIYRYDLIPGGGLAARWDSPYHGTHRMSGNVWASPLGDVLVTRGGDVYTSGEARAQDMNYIAGLSVSSITQLAWDAAHSAIFTVEGSTLHIYDLATRLPIRTYTLAGAGSFVGSREGDIFVLVPSGSATIVQLFTRRPTAAAGVDRAVESESEAGAHVRLDGSGSSDPDSTPGTNDDIVSFQWFEVMDDGSRALLASGPTADVVLALGAHRVLLRVVDHLGHWGEDTAVIVVEDSVLRRLPRGSPRVKEPLGSRAR